MALQGYDGFDHYNTYVDFFSRQGNWTWTPDISSHPTFSTDTRFGIGKSISLTNLDGVFGNVSINNSQVFLGMANKYSGGGNFEVDIREMPANVVHGKAIINLNNGSVQVRDATNALVYSSPAGHIPSNAWGYMEVSCTPGPNPTGNLQIRWNGGTEANVSGNFYNTANGAIGTVNQIRMISSGLGAVTLIDDFYFNNSAVNPGTFPNNTFNGDSTVTTLYATSNDSVQWTPLASTNWVEISEIAMDGDTSYNYASTVGFEDLFTFAPLPPLVSGVIAVQVTGAFRNETAGSRALSQKLSSGGTEVAGSSRLLNTGYSYWCDFWTLDPHTGSNWTILAVNSLFAGYHIDS